MAYLPLVVVEFMVEQHPRGDVVNSSPSAFWRGLPAGGSSRRIFVQYGTRIIYWDAVRDAGIRLKLSVMTQKPGILQVLPGTFDGTVHRMRVKAVLWGTNLLPYLSSFFSSMVC